jgi:hypothetical protein
MVLASQRTALICLLKSELDAFSAAAKLCLDPSLTYHGVVEWNWGDMLRHLTLDLACELYLGFS